MSDNKKDIKDSHNDKNVNGLVSSFSSSFKSEFQVFLIQKAERLASALYIVTDFVSNEDPIKGRLRISALDLVSYCSDPGRAPQGFSEAFSARCLEIGVTLKLAERAGVVSPTNAQILCSEYASLASFAKENQDVLFSRSAYDALQKYTHPTLPSQKALPRTNENGSRSNNNSKTFASKRHQDRRSIILSLLDKKDKINIKDATDAIEGCSEKTVQRELISLVNDGVLLKEGERRWSTYRKIK